MHIQLVTSWLNLFSGLIIGLFFGFLLRKGHLTRFSVIVGQLLLRDFTVMKVMLTAIVTGSIGIYTLQYFLPEHTLLIKPKMISAVLVGGAIFGVGMATLGFCPGTAVGALADGARDVWFGILGMLAGAALFAEVYPWLKDIFFVQEQMNTWTLPQALLLSPGVVIGALVLMLLAVFASLRKR